MFAFKFLCVDVLNVVSTVSFRDKYVDCCAIELF